MKNKIFLFVLLFITVVLVFYTCEEKNRKELLQKEEENKIVYEYYDTENIIIVGDSRSYAASKIIKEENLYFVAKNGATCNYLWETAVEEVNKILEEHSEEHFNILINLGVNDLNKQDKRDGEKICNAEDYANYYIKLKEKWMNHNVFFASVNPIDEELMKTGKYKDKNKRTNQMILEFNQEIKSLTENFGILYCDTFTKLMEEGFKSKDGLHYKDITTKEIVKKTKECTKNTES